jgi:hypothetical protein
VVQKGPGFNPSTAERKKEEEEEREGGRECCDHQT